MRFFIEEKNYNNYKSKYRRYIKMSNSILLYGNGANNFIESYYNSSNGTDNHKNNDKILFIDAREIIDPKVLLGSYAIVSGKLSEYDGLLTSSIKLGRTFIIKNIHMNLSLLNFLQPAIVENKIENFKNITVENNNFKLILTSDRDIDGRYLRININNDYNIINCDSDEDTEENNDKVIMKYLKQYIKDDSNITKALKLYYDKKLFDNSTNLKNRVEIYNILSTLLFSYKTIEERKELENELRGYLVLTESDIDNYLYGNYHKDSCDRDNRYIDIINGLGLGITSNIKILIKDIFFCINNNLPVLLVGETGTGKTTIIQKLHENYNNKLLVYNISADTELSDLIGTYKSYDISLLYKKIEEILKDNGVYRDGSKVIENENSGIKQLDVYKNILSSINYNKLDEEIEKAYKILRSPNNLYYSYSILVEAMRNGDWLLLDEINLCSTDVLNGLDSILSKAYGECGKYFINTEYMNDAIPVHENFRVFATMNPEGIGKKDFDTKTFIKIYCDDFSKNIEDIEIVTEAVLKKKKQSNDYNPIDNDSYSLFSYNFITEISDFYFNIRKSIAMNKLYGYGRKPLISGRTYCRVLKGIERGEDVYKYINLLFLTQLEPESKNKIVEESVFLKKYKNIFFDADNKQLKKDRTVNQKTFSNVGNFIVTPEISSKLSLLSSAIDLNIPVLLEGCTSTGKTSILVYLSKVYNRKIVRINNHENIDSSDYIGKMMIVEGKYYKNDGKTAKDNVYNRPETVYAPGPLIEALINGHWLLLDELNLCSSEILELLNSVLDDNRRIYNPYTNEYVNAHENFRLFGTQNSANYGGRKLLSDAFRNRFIEINFARLSISEIEEIIKRGKYLPTSFINIVIEIYKELSNIDNVLFSLRDVFKWVKRKNNNTLAFLYRNGVMTVVDRIRRDRDKILSIFDKVFDKYNKNFDLSRNDSVDILLDMVCDEYKTEKLKEILKTSYDKNESFNRLETENNIILFESQKILLLNILIGWQNKEPMLIVGDTGIGKTKVCEIISNLINNNGMEILNLHSNIEATDMIGQYAISDENSNDKIKPITKVIFKEGIVTRCLREGKILLLDEINLCSDSVIERLNSIFETPSSLYLTETGETIKPHPYFRVVATMNPGNDHGKKELSPALRNRFTEVWYKLNSSEIMSVYTSLLGDNFYYTDIDTSVEMSIRKIEVIKEYILNSYHYDIRMGNDINVDLKRIKLNESNIKKVKDVLKDKSITLPRYINDLPEKIRLDLFLDITELCNIKTTVQSKRENKYKLIKTNDEIGILYNNHRYTIKSNNNENNITSHMKSLSSYNFSTPTTMKNLYKIIRSLSLNRGILLEGAPGIGKTSIIENLGKLLNYNVVRINLSEGTEYSDLVGQFVPLPTEENEKNRFLKVKFMYSSFTAALSSPYTFIILDEINLCTQSIIEGLNSLFDYRESIYITELNTTVSKANNVYIFGTMNPSDNKNKRKVLPKSFNDRFIKVEMQKYNNDDIQMIINNLNDNKNNKDIDDTTKSDPKLNPNNYKENLALREKKISLAIGNSYNKNINMTYYFGHYIRIGRIIIEDINNEPLKINNYNYKTIINKRRVTILNDCYNECYNKMEDNEINNNCCQKIEKVENINNLINNINYVILHGQLNTIHNILIAYIKKIPIILKGKGRNSLLYFISMIFDHKIERVYCYNETDTNDLLGMYVVDIDYSKYQHENENTNYINNRNIMNNTDNYNDYNNNESINTSEDNIISNNMNLKIYWSDSKLVDALIKGSLIVFNNPELVEYSIFDRLNSLFEEERQLSLTEKGGIDNEKITHIANNNIKINDTTRLILLTEYSLSPAIEDRCYKIELTEEKTIIDIFKIINTKNNKNKDNKEINNKDIINIEYIEENNNKIEKSIEYLTQDSIVIKEFRTTLLSYKYDDYNNDIENNILNTINYKLRGISNIFYNYLNENEIDSMLRRIINIKEYECKEIDYDLYNFYKSINNYKEDINMLYKEFNIKDKDIINDNIPFKDYIKMIEYKENDEYKYARSIEEYKIYYMLNYFNNEIINNDKSFNAINNINVDFKENLPEYKFNNDLYYKLLIYTLDNDPLFMLLLSLNNRKYIILEELKNMYKYNRYNRIAIEEYYRDINKEDIVIKEIEIIIEKRKERREERVKEMLNIFNEDNRNNNYNIIRKSIENNKEYEDILGYGLIFYYNQLPINRYYSYYNAFNIYHHNKIDNKEIINNINIIIEYINIIKNVEIKEYHSEYIYNIINNRVDRRYLLPLVVYECINNINNNSDTLLEIKNEHLDLLLTDIESIKVLLSNKNNKTKITDKNVIKNEDKIEDNNYDNIIEDNKNIIKNEDKIEDNKNKITDKNTVDYRNYIYLITREYDIKLLEEFIVNGTLREFKDRMYFIMNIVKSYYNNALEDTSSILYRRIFDKKKILFMYNLSLQYLSYNLLDKKVDDVPVVGYLKDVFINMKDVCLCVINGDNSADSILSVFLNTLLLKQKDRGECSCDCMKWKSLRDMDVGEVDKIVNRIYKENNIEYNLIEYYNRDVFDLYSDAELEVGKIFVKAINMNDNTFNRLFYLILYNYNGYKSIQHYIYFIMAIFTSESNDDGTGLHKGEGVENISDIEYEEEIGEDSGEDNPEEGDGVDMENTGEKYDVEVNEKEEEIADGDKGSEEGVENEECSEGEEIENEKSCEEGENEIEEVDNTEEGEESVEEETGSGGENEITETENTEKNNENTENKEKNTPKTEEDNKNEIVDPIDYKYKEGIINTEQNEIEVETDNYKNNIIIENTEEDNEGLEYNKEGTNSIIIAENKEDDNTPIINNLYHRLSMILEHNKKQKYRGDYKSGKKLNLKRLIDLIVFNSTKIWKKKYKSKREYTVRLFIDNSKSMDNCDVRKVTIKTYNTIKEALKRLEIEVEMYKFGEKLKRIDYAENNTARKDINFIEKETNTEFINEFNDGINIIISDGLFHSVLPVSNNFLLVIVDSGIVNVNKVRIDNEIDNIRIIRYLDSLYINYVIVKNLEEIEDKIIEGIERIFRSIL